MGVPYEDEWYGDPTWPIYPPTGTYVEPIFHCFTCPNCGYSTISSEMFRFCPICGHFLTGEGQKQKSTDERLSNIEEMVQRILEGLEE